MKIVLASASPRRRDMLSIFNITFSQMSADIDEKDQLVENEIDTFEELAISNAVEKARTVAKKLNENPGQEKEETLILSADTLVVLDNKVYPKPRDQEDAERILKVLSGREHQVITGIAVLKYPEETLFSDVEITRVKFRSLTDSEIKWYISTGEPLDKAGAYGLQGFGAILLDGIQGDYLNVVGLPLKNLYFLLQKAGYQLLNGNRRK